MTLSLSSPAGIADKCEVKGTQAENTVTVSAAWVPLTSNRVAVLAGDDSEVLPHHQQVPSQQPHDPQIEAAPRHRLPAHARLHQHQPGKPDFPRDRIQQYRQ